MVVKEVPMPNPKIPLERIEGGQVLKQLVIWFRRSPQSFAARLDTLRTRSRLAAKRAGISRRDVDRLITDVRSRRAKT